MIKKEFNKMSRTEEQKLISDPVTVILNGEKYPVKPLVIAEAGPWRRKFVSIFDDVQALAEVTSDNKEEFSKALQEILISKPDQITELVCDYIKMDKTEFESKATSNEVIKAFEEVFALEAPFFGSAIKAMMKMRKVIIA